MEKNDELPSAFEQAQRCFNIGSGRGRRIQSFFSGEFHSSHKTGLGARPEIGCFLCGSPLPNCSALGRDLEHDPATVTATTIDATACGCAVPNSAAFLIAKSQSFVPSDHRLR
jgi:hypothetical protein